jgi:hypothetical protein
MNMKRMRGRNHRPGGGSGGGGGGGGGSPIRHHNGQIPLNRNHVFDSNGPDLRIRGTAQQLFEKYLQLGRDATSSGDRVMAEGYFQHAEHYFRILNAMAQAAQQPQGSQQIHPNNNQQRGRPGDEQDGEDRGADDPLISGSTPQPQIVERPNNDRPGPEAQERRDRQTTESQIVERTASQNVERTVSQNVERAASERPAGEPRPQRAPRQPRERPVVTPGPLPEDQQPRAELTPAES